MGRRSRILRLLSATLTRAGLISLKALLMLLVPEKVDKDAARHLS